MITKTKILSASDFVGVVDISPYLEVDRLNIFINGEQDKSCLEVLCRKTYEELITQIEADSLTSDYANLLSYLKDFLIHKTYIRYLVSSNFISTNAGMRKHSDEVSVEITSEEKGILLDQARSDATFAKNELLNYLEKNKDIFTDWADSTCRCSAKHPIQNMRFSKNKDSKVKINWS